MVVAAPREFRPGLWPTLAVAALLPLLLWLGSWQLARAEQKRALGAAFVAAADAAPVPFDAGLPRFTRVLARGRWDGARQVLLDAAVHEGRVGFRVLTPLVLEDGGLLLVDRGWVAGDPARRALPDIAISGEAGALVAPVGLVDELPRAGLTGGAPSPAAGWPRLMLYPKQAELEAAFGAPIAPRLLRLEPAVADGYARGFAPDFGVSRERHLGYAVTWFALAATLLAIWVVVNLRPRGGAAR